MRVQTAPTRTRGAGTVKHSVRENGGRQSERRLPRLVSIATSRTAREINRQVILNLIRKHQPISRADLARHSQLQRSTVSLITEQLIAERLVSEGAQSNLPRGRKPTFLHLNNARVVAIGVEIKSDKTTIAVADLSLNFLSRETMVTHRDFTQFLSELKQRIAAIRAASPQLTFTGLGVTLSGRIDPQSSQVKFAPGLPWKPADLRASLEEATGISVELENSANACVLAELWAGRYPNNVQNLIAIEVTDGVEVGMVLNGQIVRGAGGLAGAFGHVVVEESGPPCCCGNKGCLAVCGSNTAALRFYHNANSQSSRVAMDAIRFAELLQRAERGEARATQALQHMAHNLGAGIAMLIAGLSPDIVLLVGELSCGWARIGPIIDQVVARRRPVAFNTRILPVAFESQLPLRGALVLALQKCFGGPKIL